MTQQEPETIKGDILNFVRGFCMGAADSVPGVSGGTIALILGHYYRLVSAISHFDRQALRLLVARDFKTLASHVDLRFLIFLGAGVAIAIVSLASLLHWLLEHKMPETLAVFLGLIVASVLIVGRMIERWSPAAGTGMVVCAIAGYVISSLSPIGLKPSYPFLFFSAVIAITAMILPGISGSFILVLLGVYHHVTGLIKDLPRGQFTVDGLIQLVVFASGCAIGLGAFSRVLRWLIESHRDVTFACLLGLMIGSLKRVWPLQLPTPETANEKFSHRLFEFVPPSEWQGQMWHLVLLAVAAFGFVMLIERFGKGSAEFASTQDESATGNA